ncbi:putative adenylyl-sulfate kinase [Variovorax sp. WDL1]|nr:Adenylylsulfate kinase [Variovorax sp. WDL1]PNG47140.1 putative adenylyl-sulfate kinase [Variovorax sp. B2]PNG48209.1 putative adenylyl-sulfate kinase [Variovorax sp. B4]VTV15009.1 putative adenylyl-sulfate kinase [Variovorax sp. WDL1]
MTSTSAANGGSFVVWLTGLSGSGKSTLAQALKDRLSTSGALPVVLDGDRIRSGLCSDLGFDPPDRSENVRRVAEVAKIFQQGGWIALVAVIAPSREDRRLARRIIGEPNFVEVFCECPLEVCEARDVKGLYRRARRGDIEQFTGISSPYEPPLRPDLVLHTASRSVSECVDTLLAHLLDRRDAMLRQG